MRNDLFSWIAVWKLNRHNLQSSLAPIFQRGNAIRIVRYKNDAIDRLIGKVGSDIKTDSHVHSLLFEVRLEISVR